MICYYATLMRTVMSFILLLLLPVAAGAADKGLTVKGVRHASYAGFTRIVFEIETAGPYVLTRSQDGRSLMLSSYENAFVLKSPLPMVRDSVVDGMEPWEEGGRTYAVIRLTPAGGAVKDFTLRNPDRIVLDIAKAGAAAGPAPTTDKPAVVVLDPGHGGKDTGLQTGEGVEKTIDLELASAIRRILRKNERLKTVLTREKDQYLTLDERAAFANTAGVAVFVCIHAASGASARVYIQDLTDDAENTLHAAPATGDFLSYEAGSEQQATVWGIQQASHAQESGGLGRKLARLLTGTDNAEPLQAPLAGSRAVDAAAVMVELGAAFDRERAAREIARGIEQYVMDTR